MKRSSHRLIAIPHFYHVRAPCGMVSIWSSNLTGGESGCGWEMDEDQVEISYFTLKGAGGAGDQILLQYLQIRQETELTFSFSICQVMPLNMQDTLMLGSDTWASHASLQFE
jgi:hypothetical protein